MVVVVIIGILAAIAVPSYQGFQNKAKSAEAKVQLSAIYTAEKAFQAEWATFTSDLVAIGVAEVTLGEPEVRSGDVVTTAAIPAGTILLGKVVPKDYKKIGFASAQAQTIALKGTATVNNFNIGGATDSSCTVSAPAVFKACAESANADLKKWSIDQSKDLTPLP